LFTELISILLVIVFYLLSTDLNCPTKLCSSAAIRDTSPALLCVWLAPLAVACAACATAVSYCMISLLPFNASDIVLSLARERTGKVEFSEILPFMLSVLS